MIKELNDLQLGRALDHLDGRGYHILRDAVSGQCMDLIHTELHGLPWPEPIKSIALGTEQPATITAPIDPENETYNLLSSRAPTIYGLGEFVAGQLIAPLAKSLTELKANEAPDEISLRRHAPNRSTQKLRRLAGTGLKVMLNTESHGQFRVWDEENNREHPTAILKPGDAILLRSDTLIPGKSQPAHLSRAWGQQRSTSITLRSIV